MPFSPDKLIYPRDPRRGSRATRGASVALLALVAAALLLAMPGRAGAVGVLTVTNVEPNGGPEAGGTFVTITGTGFVEGTTVSFGASAASKVTFNSATSITATSPKGAGTVDVIVTTPEGSSPTSSADRFTYLPVPTVTNLEPNGGPEGGSTEVAITGTGFVEGTTVSFGASAASKVTFNSPTSIAATSPAGMGTQHVTVTTPGGTSPLSSADQFSYLPVPTVTKIEPKSGPEGGGTSVTIIGTGFVEGATAVKFGSTSAAVTNVTSTSITATSPAGTGTQHVTVTTPGGMSPLSSADEFTYLPIPTVTKVEPKSGPLGGGTSVTITGTGFVEGATGVKFGSTSATNIKVVSAASITATSPLGLGTVDVTVTTPGGTSLTSSADQFTYKFTFTFTIPSIPGGSGSGGGGTVPLPPVGLPAPLLARSGNVFYVTGRVNLRLPGTRTFLPLRAGLHIPYRTVVDATNGEVSITTATRKGGTQTGQFFDGQFVLTQGRDGTVMASLAGGDFSPCRRSRTTTQHASGKHLVRRLWATASGSFTTKGRYATAAARGAQWLTEDACEATLILATRNRVQVTDLVRHRRITLLAGQVYIAKAR
jgi:hypothetical protein